MNRVKPKSRHSWISKGILSLFITAGLASTSSAVQFDAPYYEFMKKNGDKWAKEDKAIDSKLAALEKKFGKKPNIIYRFSHIKLHICLIGGWNPPYDLFIIDG